MNVLVVFALLVASATCAPYYPYFPGFYGNPYPIFKTVDLEKDVKSEVFFPHPSYPVGHLFAYDEPAKKEESSRKRRQVVAAAFTPYNQFAADMAYKSVDLDKDGQPDNYVKAVPTVKTVPVVAAPYPYPYFYGTYSYSYTHY